MCSSTLMEEDAHWIACCLAHATPYAAAHDMLFHDRVEHDRAAWGEAASHGF